MPKNYFEKDVRVPMRLSNLRKLLIPKPLAKKFSTVTQTLTNLSIYQNFKLS